MSKGWGITIVPVNAYAWAIGSPTKRGGRKVRRIVWGRALAREEKRRGEKIWRVWIVTKE